jgi:hypothetical protein
VSVIDWLSKMQRHGELSATAYALFTLNRRHTTRRQVKLLAQFVNDRSKETVYMQQRLTDLERLLPQTIAQTSGIKRKTLGHIETRILELERKIDRKPAMGNRGPLHLHCGNVIRPRDMSVRHAAHPVCPVSEQTV